MKIRLIEMKLQNFAGIEHLEIKPDKADLAVNGANGTGKTTLANAWLWLLFGKNTAGRADFGVKPLDENGNEIHYLDTSVEALISFDAEVVRLKRVLSEKWVRERGKAEKTFKGNDTTYFVNGEQVKKNQYQAKIEMLVPEKIFKLITDPFFFNEKLHWTERRKMLLDVVGGVDNKEVLAALPSYQPVFEELFGAGKSIEAARDELNAELKNLDKQLQAIPIQMEEAQRASMTAAGNEQELLTACKNHNTEMERLTVEATELKNGAEKIRLQSLIKEKEMNLENIKDLKIESTGDYQAYKGLQESIDNAEKQLFVANHAYDETNKNIPVYNSHIKARKEWLQDLQEKRFDGDICPTCGQTLPAEQLEEKHKQFNLNRAKEIDELEQEKQQLETSLVKELATQKEKSDEIQRLKEAIDNMKAQAAEFYNSAMDTVGNANFAFEGQREVLRAEIVEIQKEIDNYDDSISEKIEQLKQAYIVERDNRTAAEEKLSEIRVASRNAARVEELRQQQKEVAAKYTETEKQLFACEQFVRTKAELLGEKVNGLFDIAVVKMFDKQVNGNLAETCEISVAGVPYADLNNAARINVGLDVINTISALHGVEVPVFIDNAESVTDIMHTDAQQIRLYVDSAAKKLRFERI